MPCCGEREKFGSATNEQRWDFINLSDFKSTSCWSTFSYGLLYFFLIISIAVYIVDIYTASNLLLFDRWSSQVKPFIPFRISKWVFAGCIFLSWIELAYRWWRGVKAMKSGIITASYLDPLAVRIESIRPGKAQGFRRFLVFTALTKGRKGSEYVALFTYYSFEAWLRIIFAEGPRQVINALTLYSVLQAKLIPHGEHAPSQGHSPVVQFFVNVRILANSSTQQATILFGMLYVLIVWVFTALSLIVAFLMYITFLWHHIPSADGTLSKFCRRKIEKRLHQIVRARVDKAIAEEHIDRVKKVATGGAGASVGAPSQQMDVKRQPTLPVLDTNATVSSTPISAAATAVTSRPASPFGSRPASPFVDRPASPRPGYAKSALSREPTLPDTSRNSPRPEPPSRNTTKSSMYSNASYASDAPLMGSAAPMGHRPPDRRYPSDGPSTAASIRSMGQGRRPLPRSNTEESRSTQRSARNVIPNKFPPLRLNTGLDERSTTPGSTSFRHGSTPRGPASASSTPSSRRPPGATNFSRRPTLEYEMQMSPSSSRAPPEDYFGDHRPPRAGTAPAIPHSTGYDDTIYDAYIPQNSSSSQASNAARPGTAGSGYRFEAGKGRENDFGRREVYNPPRF